MYVYISDFRQEDTYKPELNLFSRDEVGRQLGAELKCVRIPVTTWLLCHQLANSPGKSIYLRGE